MKPKKTIEFFSKRYYGRASAIKPEQRICGCCGAHFEKVDSWATTWYQGANGASGNGIMLSVQLPTKALQPNEKVTEVVSKNGTFYFTTKHK